MKLDSTFRHLVTHTFYSTGTKAIMMSLTSEWELDLLDERSKFQISWITSQSIKCVFVQSAKLEVMLIEVFVVVVVIVVNHENLS